MKNAITLAKAFKSLFRTVKNPCVLPLFCIEATQNITMNGGVTSIQVLKLNWFHRFVNPAVVPFIMLLMAVPMARAVVIILVAHPLKNVHTCHIT